ncbi:MAG: fasciclin domain-containing protein [Gemmatimonadota bacterium]|nr:fasciclin domain-containing protein [Gemmatimonadota bacterium]
MTTATQAPTNLKDIIETAITTGSFNTLTAALTAAGLVETLKGVGPFTVFAPSDAAFAKLPAGTVEALLTDKPKLTAILTYHVAPGILMAADVASIATVDTVQGGALKVTDKDGKVMINGAEVVTPDVRATNGVIHVIDSVLLPT